MGIVEDHVRLQRIASGFPVVTKLWLLFLGPLTVILAVCVEDAIQKGNEESRRQAVAQAPAYMNHFESLIQSVTAERAAAMQFLSTRNRTSLEEAHANTDAETAQMNRVLSRLTAEGVSSDSYTKSFSAKDIAHARSLTVSSNIPEKYVFYAYSEVIRNSLSAIFADFHSSPKGMLLTTQVSMSISNAYLKLEQAAFLHANSVAPTEVTASMRKRMLKLRVGRESYTELLEGVIPDGTYLDMIHDDAGYKELLKRDVPEVRMNCSKAETGLAAEIVSLLDNAATEISESTVEHIDTSLDAITVHLSLDIACIIVLIVFFAVQVAIMAVRRMNNSYEKDKSEELNAMIDTVDRIAEYSAYFAMFDLRVPLLPAGRTLTHLELTLMKCQAALKIVAPALPPELFPERYVVKQQTENIAQRDMCDMELMMNQLPPHHPDSVPVVHSTLREANSAKATSLMTRRCKLGLQEQEGAFLTVSFSWLHSRVDNNNGQQPKYVEPYISLIENAVVTHEGLVHKLCGDRMLCSWNIASWVEESSLLACKAGLAILPATTPLYKSNEIHVACAVTYGKVLAGNVGFSPNTQGGIDSPLTAKDVGTSMRTPVAQEPKLASDGMRTYTMFGDPITLGGRVVFYQNFYNTATAVLCDEETAKRVNLTLVVKPLEPIMRSDTSDEVVSIFSIVGLVLGQRIEEVECLQLFNRAYSLFIQRKFLEAEKAFCHYTKIYGYDNVVERLHKLVAHGMTVDDAHIYDVTHLD